MTNNIAKILEEKNISRQEFAGVMDISIATAHNWCQNKTQPKLSQVLMLETELDISNEQLFNY